MKFARYHYFLIKGTARRVSNTNRPSKSKGVALITVLLIVALASILATQMTGRLHVQMQRTNNVALNQQAYWYAMGAEAFAKRVLMESFEGEKDFTHLEQYWAQGESTYPVDFGQISGEIKDLQSCLNLNDLRPEIDENGSAIGGANSNKKPLLNRVLTDIIVGLNIENVSEFEAESMVDALTDWLDKDSAISGMGGAEDNDYAGKEFPYLPGNNFLASINELRVVEHFTVPVINALKDHACVIPDVSLKKININTLAGDSSNLIAAILDISQGDAEKILSERPEEGYKKVTDFLSSQAMSGITLTDEQKDLFSVDSEYFTLKASASFNNSYFYLNSIMKVENNQQITVISRSVGRF